MILIEDDQMIETFSADTSNYSFCVWILKRRMGRGDHFVNLHPFYPCLYRKVRLSFFSYTYRHLVLIVNLPLLTIPLRYVYFDMENNG